MNHRIWSLAIGGVLPLFSHAAAMEKSDQSIRTFLEPKHYIELSYAELYADVSGQLLQREELKQQGIHDFSTGNLINTYHFVNAAAKLQIAAQWSFGFIYDQPYGVDIAYQYRPQSDHGKALLESGQFNFDSQNLTMLLGYQPTSHWNIYTGAVYQQFEGKLNVFGTNYSAMSGYQAKFEQSAGYGWLTGLSYQIPEYALKSSLTYRSKINHQATVAEYISGQSLAVVPFEKTQISTPQSLNLEIQSGLTANNILYSQLRWVNWKDFEIQPRQFSAVVDYAVQQYPEFIKPFNLIDYKKNQWSAKLGIAHMFSDQWLTTADLSWDSGNDNPAGTLNPSDGFYALGLGGMYNFNKNSFISYGIKYFRFQKAKVADLDANNPITQNSTLAEVGRNVAFAHGIRMGYRF